jgi:hypothetical protein
MHGFLSGLSGKFHDIPREREPVIKAGFMCKPIFDPLAEIAFGV